MKLSAKLDRSRIGGALNDFYRDAVQRSERAALIATDRASRTAVTEIREAMSGAGLGRLGNALGQTSDLRNGNGVRRRGETGFSASGTVFARSKSARSMGAIAAYTEGADIRPRGGRWLWIPTPDIRRVTGARKQRERVTPGNWARLGLASKIGPLELVPSVDGRPLLIVRNAGVSLVGKAGSARALKKNGQARRGQMAKPFLVAFIGIPATSRAARVNVTDILRRASASLPSLFAQALGAR
jgi:hypothetical protein